MRPLSAALLSFILCAFALASCGGSKESSHSPAVKGPAPKWTLKIGSIDVPLALGPDGTLYAVNDSGKLMAIDPSGSIRWTQQVASVGRRASALAVGSDGAIYVLAFGKLAVFNPDGTTRIEKTMGTLAFGPALALTDKRVYTACLGDRGVCAWTLDQGMDLIWALGGQGYGAAPAIQPDGTVILAGDSVVAAGDFVSPPRWTYPANLQVTPANGEPDTFGIFAGHLYAHSVAAGKDGATYFTASGLVALDVNGQKLWSLNFQPYPGVQPVVAADGTVYYASHNMNLYALRPDGTTLWSLKTTALANQPLIGSNGTIFFTDYNALRAVSPDGKDKWKSDIDIESVSAPTLGDDGTLYVASRQGTLYAFPVGESLMQSPWPKFQANLRNSGQANQ